MTPKEKKPRKLARGREEQFLWPESWGVPSCGNRSPIHLRAPINRGLKDPNRIRSIIAGLNPGKTELANSEFFVGRAGVALRSASYERLWKAAGEPREVLVTNILKLSTANAAGLKELDPRAVQKCVSECFLGELRALPKLERIFLLGADAERFFEEHCRDAFEPTAPSARGAIGVYLVRHPSYSWLDKQLEAKLEASVVKPVLCLKLRQV